MYLTNFEHVWVQELDKQGFTTAADSVGFEDVSDADLVDLLKAISEDVVDNIEFGPQGDHIIAVTRAQITWKFSLVKQDASRTVLFLARLNYQQFANMSFLKYQVESLKDVISVKDQYARFLATNFKQSHGTELIDNYKRNNRSDLEAIEKFNALRWDKRSSIEYRKMRSKRRGLNDEELDRNIAVAVKEPWKFANLFYLNVTEEQEELSPVKFESDESQSPLGTQSQSSQNVRFESEPTLDLSYVDLSPPKKKSFEFKRPIASQSSSQDTSQSQSQRKRRKIGSLSRR
ncbi:hypothetical protein Cantr_01207 [Candida viswanathii]|uniref:Uncharacterized protein n=1 Tax=Candida viswanathii TaxID=5486 RepID=A0A367YJW6_9ASCO|nr:hypothetical protein Cantr_01207 [Candida viswanathii]